MKKSYFLMFVIFAMMIVQTSCKEDIAITGISFDKTTLSLSVGSSNTITVIKSPTNATAPKTIWISSDVSKATVVNGTVFAVADGIAIITARVGDLKATCTVTVGTPSPEAGVLINGVRWATRNVDTPGNFVTSPEDYGYFYEWNNNVGWSPIESNGIYSTTDASTWGSGNRESDYWIPENDPSPLGWRVPSIYEQQKLFESSIVSNIMTTQNNVYGCKFTDKVSGNSIFFPAAGYLYNYGVLYNGKLLDLTGVGVSGQYSSNYCQRNTNCAGKCKFYDVYTLSFGIGNLPPGHGSFDPFTSASNIRPVAK